MDADGVDSKRGAALREIPSLDAWLRSTDLTGLPRRAVLRGARALLDELRHEAQRGRFDSGALQRLFADGQAEALLRERVTADVASRHRRVVNATGIVLHTGIGRAPLAQAACVALQDAAGYAVVEVDQDSGKRNERETHVAALLCDLTGATGALVVNNNAAAVNLILAACARGREVVVSRGEQVEIGGGFRMPEVMASSGCRMVEVGTTNRTHLRDYRSAMGLDTAMLLKVHPSNFLILGFTETPALAELVELARGTDTLVVEDLGSGLLLEAPPPGLEHEPLVRTSVQSGAHLVCFSGDKLLGGPQCGIVVGQRELVAQLRAHPMYRAFRCDKLALAALEATLRVYRDGDPAREIPTLAMLFAGGERLRERAEELRERLHPLVADVVPSESFAGSGANPARPLPSFAVALAARREGAEATSARLRRAPGVPVFARVVDGRVWCDLRTLELEDLGEVAAAIQGKLGRAGAGGTTSR